MSEPPAERPRPASEVVLALWRGLGVLIMMLGIALAALSGLCTAAFVVADMEHVSEAEEFSGLELFVGGPFILMGALMWWGGWAISREKWRLPGAEGAGSKEPPKESE